MWIREVEGGKSGAGRGCKEPERQTYIQDLYQSLSLASIFIIEDQSGHPAVNTKHRASSMKTPAPLQLISWS